MNLRGSKWEQLAESFLHGRGLKTVQRNFHCRMGEIDLIMLDGQTLVFTEVRYRATYTKQRRIIIAAQIFLRIRQHHASQVCRFDVVSIGNEEGRTLINWIQNAFDAS